MRAMAMMFALTTLMLSACRGTDGLIDYGSRAQNTSPANTPSSRMHRNKEKSPTPLNAAITATLAAGRSNLCSDGHKEDQQKCQEQQLSQSELISEYIKKSTDK